MRHLIFAVYIICFFIKFAFQVMLIWNNENTENGENAF